MTTDLVEGATLRDGRYRLERRLGAGGMAVVWLANDMVLERPVAVRVLSDVLAGDPGYVARFRREGRVAARLTHPSLVRGLRPRGRSAPVSGARVRRRRSPTGATTTAASSTSTPWRAIC